MKKNILLSVLLLALLATAGYVVHKSMKSDAGLNDLALANVEALANGEMKGSGTCYNSITLKEGSNVILYCGTCRYIPGTKSWFSGTGECP